MNKKGYLTLICSYLAFVELCLCALLLTPLTHAEEVYYSSATPALKLKLIKSKQNHMRFEVTTQKPQETSFLKLENPARAVIDIRGSTLKHSTKAQLKQNSFVKAIRFGTHPEHLRIVLDLTDDVIDLEADSKERSLILAISGTERESPGAAALTESTAQSSSSTSSLSSASAPASKPIEISTPPPSPVLTPAPNIKGVAELQGLHALNFDYLAPEQTPILKLSLTCKPQFKLSKKDNKSYKIFIPDCDLASESLTLPQFPPQDFIGFTFVKANKQNNGVEVVIGVDRETRLTAFTKNQEIVLRASK